MKFAKEGWPFVLPFVLLSALFAALARPFAAALSGLSGLLVLLFFRDPERRFDGPEDIVVAPADGLVTKVSSGEFPEIGPGRYHHVVTFLSVFDVHVQRTPTDGRVLTSALRTGRKVAAFREDAGVVNEQHLTVLERPDGDRVGICQIAGLFARRVVCYAAEGEERHRGQHLGVIKFGSRVDLYVPESYRVLVAKGDRLRNGETPVAEA